VLKEVDDLSSVNCRLQRVTSVRPMLPSSAAPEEILLTLKAISSPTKKLARVFAENQ
jgi:hypothetical protein